MADASNVLETTHPKFPVTQATNALPLTTPFVQPEGCETIRDYTTWRSLLSFDESNQAVYTTFDVGISWPGNPAYSSCQPTGWDHSIKTFDFETNYFSPGVCPDRWITQSQLASLWVDTSMSSSWTMTGAWCCQSGYYRMGEFALDMSNYIRSTSMSLYYPCFSVFGPNDTPQTATITSDGRSGQITTLTRGILAHPAMKIEWQDTDVVRLTPQPSTVTIDQFASQSLPNFGASSPTTSIQPTTSTSSTSYQYNNTSYPMPFPADGEAALYHKEALSAGLGLGLGLPFFLIALFFCCCYWRRRRRRQKRALELSEARVDRQPDVETFMLDDLSSPPEYLAHHPVPKVQDPPPTYAVATS